MITRSDGASGRRTHTLLSRAKDENTNKRKMMFNTAGLTQIIAHTL